MMVTLLSSLLVLTAAAQTPSAEDKPAAVRFEVQIIHATRGKPFVDPSIEKLSRYLENSFGSRYQRFRRLKNDTMTLGVKERGTQKLPNGTKLLLTYLGAEDSLLRLVMEVGGMKTTVKVHDGGLFFQAGRKHKNGMLIVAIRAFTKN
ncbi:MAG: hypothetical protein ACI9OJ_003074 [Myxococcota bacterium]|jgi:hypothetical protein